MRLLQSHVIFICCSPMWSLSAAVPYDLYLLQPHVRLDTLGTIMCCRVHCWNCAAVPLKGMTLMLYKSVLRVWNKSCDWLKIIVSGGNKSDQCFLAQHFWLCTLCLILWPGFSLHRWVSLGPRLAPRYVQRLHFVGERFTHVWLSEYHENKWNKFIKMLTYCCL